MFKIFSLIITIIFWCLYVENAFAASYVNVVNPVRGKDFWEAGFLPEETVFGELKVINKYRLPATWLLRYDALSNEQVIGKILGARNQEAGLFLEVTPTWAKEAGVAYQKSESWRSAGSVLLTGYDKQQRQKLIDQAFAKFHLVFGFYPKSVGAWWIDGFSLDYMQKQYQIEVGLIVADQYSTDNYQIWGQYWQAPYLPYLSNVLHPAQEPGDKIPVVLLQWASRDPVNGYGKAVEESTYSVQANDYLDYHKLDNQYFSKLVDIYTRQPLNKFNQLTVGLENTYSWALYGGEYEKQINLLSDKQKIGELEIVTMSDFSNKYRLKSEVSPNQVVVAQDPLNTGKKAVWFMNPYYRAGLFVNSGSVAFLDIRQYLKGDAELCRDMPCRSVNFATFATRVLDNVTYGSKWQIDSGNVYNFQAFWQADDFVVQYRNDAGKIRKITFEPKDIRIDDKTWSIDAAILNAISNSQSPQKLLDIKVSSNIFFKGEVWSIFFGLIKFLILVIFGFYLPGKILLKKALGKDIFSLHRLFLETVVGVVALTLIGFIALLLQVRLLIWIYLLLCWMLFLLSYIRRTRLVQLNSFLKKVPGQFMGIISRHSILMILIIVGTIFQTLPTLRSGLEYNYGLGFWGPNGHDGIWHISLINQLIRSNPPENPVFSGVNLMNYHYLFDLLVAVSNIITGINASDLLFRFFPVLLSLGLGIGVYLLTLQLFNSGKSALVSVYLAYFCGSFGWIVSYLKDKSLSGESTFWANQSVSFNLNPPFAISLVLIIALMLLLREIGDKRKLILVIISGVLVGTLIAFKSYAWILVIGCLSVVGFYQLAHKKWQLFFVLLVSLPVAFLLILPSYLSGQSIQFPQHQIFIWSPLWFVHSMAESPDRLGWSWLSLARYQALSNHNILKLVFVEGLGVFIFIVGNLGMRLFGLLSAVWGKLCVDQELKVYLLVLSALSLIIPLLFIQSGNAWNTIQFIYYFMAIMAIFSGGFIYLVVKKLTDLPKIIFLVAILVFSALNSYTSIKDYIYLKPASFIPAEELEGLKFLSKAKYGAVLTYPYQVALRSRLSDPLPIFAYAPTAYVASYSEKPVFVADEIQNEILQTDYPKRQAQAENFFANPDKEFLVANSIDYVYLPKVYGINVNDVSFLEKIFDNKIVSVYRLKK